MRLAIPRFFAVFLSCFRPPPAEITLAKKAHEFNCAVLSDQERDGSESPPVSIPPDAGGIVIITAQRGFHGKTPDFERTCDVMNDSPDTRQTVRQKFSDVKHESSDISDRASDTKPKYGQENVMDEVKNEIDILTTCSDTTSPGAVELEVAYWCVRNMRLLFEKTPSMASRFVVATFLLGECLLRSDKPQWTLGATKLYLVLLQFCLTVLLRGANETVKQTLRKLLLNRERLDRLRDCIELVILRGAFCGKEGELCCDPVVLLNFSSALVKDAFASDSSADDVAMLAPFFQSNGVLCKVLFSKTTMGNVQQVVHEDHDVDAVSKWLQSLFNSPDLHAKVLEVIVRSSISPSGNCLRREFFPKVVNKDFVDLQYELRSHLNDPRSIQAVKLLELSLGAASEGPSRLLRLLAAPLFDVDKYKNVLMNSIGAYGLFDRVKVETPPGMAAMEVNVKKIFLPVPSTGKSLLPDLYGMVTVLERNSTDKDRLLLDFGVHGGVCYLVRPVVGMWRWPETTIEQAVADLRD